MAPHEILLQKAIGAVLNDCTIDLNDIPVLENKDWKQFINLSRYQAVDVLVYDKVLDLPEKYLPPRDLRYTMLAQIHKFSSLVDGFCKVVSSVTHAYKYILNIDFLIFKGPSNARNYPKPQLRSIGDLDIYFMHKSDFFKANNWAIESGYVYHIDQMKKTHWSYEVGSHIIENHANITFFENHKINEVFQSYLSETIAQNKFDTFTLDGQSYHTLEPTINAIYIFAHFFYHFVHGGVGFKQYMDWILHMKVHHSRIDSEKFIEIAKSIKMYQPIQYFARCAVDCFGLSETIFPFMLSSDGRYSKFILLDIMTNGNFGILHTRYWKGLWLGRLHKYLKQIGRTMKISRLSFYHTYRVPMADLQRRIYLTFRCK